ncbi:flagellar hook assembly protein FlgD [Halobacteriovorax sp. HLS]|uniref:flagellar hook assembly protein FlgD n=1 Tax=Halobacteriovorax sp. HLS TaxID=2234000 RepID=UPI000FDB13E4|nr:flagellar hook assembly protein FlgD [Halobacteriovorax sp. HLS]
MAEIGRPQQANPFNGIALKKSSSKKKAKAIGEKLNDMAGIRPEQKFVDAKEHNKLGKDGFLKLLSHQLANQDPLKPMDQKQFAADLAQFSQLEQLTNMNKKMEGMQKNDGTENKFMAASFIGKEVTSSGTSISYDGEGRTVNLPFHLDKPARNLMVRVYDTKNQLIAQIEKESLGQGSQNVIWDGLQLDGTVAVKDNYRIDVTAYDEEMNKFKGKTKSTGLVTGVHFDNGEAVLEVDNTKKVYLRDVDNFSLPNGKSSGALKNMPGLKKNAAQAYNKIESQIN